MKVLIITPRSPFQGKGADEQDRLSGIRWFIDNSWEVRVVTKTLDSDLPTIFMSEKELGISITPVSYKSKKDPKTLIKRLLNPFYWDGAAYEYFDREIQDHVRRELAGFQPDLVWFDYTYLWPLYPLVRKMRVPIVTRSINFEPVHFLDEDGWGFVNIIRSLPKFVGEMLVSRWSNVLFSITPKELKIYSMLRAHAINLPLRGLPQKFEVLSRNIDKHKQINLGFTASSYNVKHNLGALKFLLDKVLPQISVDFRLYITGSKLPEDIKKNLPERVSYLGFTPSLEEFWEGVDIAIMPSLFGSGMQQKVFEPLVRGVPTVTSARAIAGYPFIDGVHFVSAYSAEDFAQAINDLANNIEKRKYISHNSSELSSQLFSQDRLDSIIREGLSHIDEKIY